jgi:hypothetical protein
VLNAQLAAEVPPRAQNLAQVQAALHRTDPPQQPMQPSTFASQRAPDSGVYVNAPPSGFDPNRAAGLMSPVGPNYPQQDWEIAAAKPAKAVPPWMFAVLFVVGFGIALALTIAIAKALH